MAEGRTKLCCCRRENAQSECCCWHQKQAGTSAESASQNREWEEMRRKYNGANDERIPFRRFTSFFGSVRNNAIEEW